MKLAYLQIEINHHLENLDYLYIHLKIFPHKDHPLKGRLFLQLRTGIILRFLSLIIDRLFFINNEFKITEYENFGLIIFISSIFVGVLWLYRVKNITN